MANGILFWVDVLIYVQLSAIFGLESDIAVTLACNYFENLCTNSRFIFFNLNPSFDQASQGKIKKAILYGRFIYLITNIIAPTWCPN